MSLTNTQHNLEQPQTGLPVPIIQTSSGAFREDFNRASFQFSHNLAGHPLFEIPRLVKLAEFLIEFGPGNIRCQISNVPIESKWIDAPLKEQVQQQLPKFIANINTSDSWLLLYHVQRDPEYQAILEQVIAELGALTGKSLQGEITWKDAYIFIASPHSITPYHIDHESTCLFQIHGNRQATLFDAYDRTVVTDQELENFYIGDYGAANYREENRSKANVYSMTAGTGVHHPVCAPHCYQNGDSFSIAFGVHLGLRSFDLNARVYQVNHYLRKFGFQPTPPGKSALKDKLKTAAVGLFTKRNPENKADVLMSGIRRMAAPLSFGKQLAHFLKK